MLLFSSDEVGPTTAEHAKKRDGDTDISESKKKKKKLKSNKKKKVSLLCTQVTQVVRSCRYLTSNSEAALSSSLLGCILYIGMK
jgi:hypothetical protein